MTADISRRSFRPERHYRSVLMQQGRVSVDADWNEQADLSLYQVRRVVADLVGPFGGPRGACGFELVPHRGAADGDFLIGPGRYYVDGLLCENDGPLAYSEQPGYPFDAATTIESLRGAGQVLVYLDVWERFVSAIEDPHLADPALGGADTSGRTQLVWQVKVLRGERAPTCGSVHALRRRALPLMRARTAPDPAGSGYRGMENRLYRVEIRRGGPARDAGAKSGGATFAWSRANASVAFPVLSYAVNVAAGETSVSLGGLGKGRGEVRVGDWVELVDDLAALREAAPPLWCVARVDGDASSVVLAGVSDDRTGQDAARHPLVRRWDHDASDAATSGEGALLVREAGGPDDGWIALEDGVLVQFPGVAGGGATEYRAGDHWMIPARTATRDVLWPREGVGAEARPEARPPDGVEHCYAPLAVGSLGADGRWRFEEPDCRRTFRSLARPSKPPRGRKP